MKLKFLYGFFIATITLFAASCKKDSADSKYYVKLKKSGTWVSYPVTAGEFGPDLGNPAFTNLGVAAQTTDGKERFDLIIQLNGTSFPTGSYSSDNPSYQVIMSMFITNGSTISNYDINDAPGMPASKYVIQITSITNDALTGTFTGNYLYDNFGSSSSSTMDITEGEFHVKRIR